MPAWMRSGFSLGDTPRNGLSVMVTTRMSAASAQAVAADVAARRAQWVTNPEMAWTPPAPVEVPVRGG